MEKIIVIQGEQDEIKVGVIEEKRLVEFYSEAKTTDPLVGSIFKGRVENVLPGMQSAFVNIGLTKNAFLFVQEAIQPTGDETGTPVNLPPIEDVVQEGQELMVQIIKEPNGQKGARISTQITLAGRYVVYLPLTDHIGISRKIEDGEERDKLKKIAEKLKGPGEGMIVRTVALGKEEQELAEDFAGLRVKWQLIKKKYEQFRAPSGVYYDLGLGERLVRDFIKDDVSSIIVNDQELFDQIANHLALSGSGIKNFMVLDKEDLFFKYQLYDEIENALKPKIWLNSGGYLVFSQTEALLVIDVNTGKYVGHKSLEDTVFRVNLEAVRETCRQIRLRNIGGIIIIDFIDMKEEAHKQQVLATLLEEVKKDQLRVTVLGITNLGLVELTRKKVRSSLANFFQVECPTCCGTGLIRKGEQEN